MTTIKAEFKLKDDRYCEGCELISQWESIYPDFYCKLFSQILKIEGDKHYLQIRCQQCKEKFG